MAAPTVAQVRAYYLHRNTCLQNKFGQTQFFHRLPEGTITTVQGFPNNIDFTDSNPRTQDNPMQPFVLVWMTWAPRRLMGISEAAGDNKALRAWIWRFMGQCAAIDDNGNVITIQDEDFGISAQTPGRFRIENPVLSPDAGSWQFEGVRMR